MTNVSSPSRARERTEERNESMDVMRETIKVVSDANADFLPQLFSQLSSIHIKVGNWNTAILILEAIKDAAGKEHPSTLSCMAKLSAMLAEKGKLELAVDFGKEVLGMRRDVLGENHVNTLQSASNLAAIYQQGGHYREAALLLSDTLEKTKAALGEVHPKTLGCMSSLVTIIKLCGRYKEAETLARQVLEIRERALNEEDPDLLTSMSDLAMVLAGQDRYEEAATLFRQTMMRRRKVLGMNHPDTLGSTANLATMFVNQGKWKLAEQLASPILSTMKRVLGVEHASTLSTMANMAVAFRGQGRYEESEQLQLEVVDTTKRVFGEEHPRTLIYMESLASTYCVQGRYVDAGELHLRVVRAQENVLGINIWIPSASFWAFTQTHPFTVVSWSDKPQEQLDLFIQPRQGFTRSLFNLADYGPTTSVVAFSGPHGRAVLVDQYDDVLMIATGFGIAAHLPYLRKLVFDHHTRKTSIHRIHLVWQIGELDIGIAAQRLLNDALAEDSSEGDYILRISIYVEPADVPKMSFGNRATVFPGIAPLEDILSTEFAERRAGSKAVVIVSATAPIRDDLTAIMSRGSRHKTDLVHAEY